MSETKANLDEVILDWYLQELANDGWRIISRTPTAAEVARGRQWNRRGLMIAVAIAALGMIMGWPWIIVAGILAFVVVAVDYVKQRPNQSAVTAQQAREAARLLEGGAQR